LYLLAAAHDVLLLAYAHNPCSQPFVLTCYCIIFIYKQFSYIYYPSPYKYTTQLGVILRREYPGVIVEVDEYGDDFKRPALDWADYFHKNPGTKGMTRGENVVSKFWVRCSI